MIGLTTNVGFSLPYNVSSPADAAAANRNMAFQFAWYYDPIVFGKYPDEMTQLITDGRLPTFTPDEARTSVMPPTFVDTTIKPDDAASTIAMQKASVREVFRNISIYKILI